MIPVHQLLTIKKTKVYPKTFKDIPFILKTYSAVLSTISLNFFSASVLVKSEKSPGSVETYLSKPSVCSSAS